MPALIGTRSWRVCAAVASFALATLARGARSILTWGWHWRAASANWAHGFHFNNAQSGEHKQFQHWRHASATLAMAFGFLVVALFALPAHAQIELPNHDPRNTISIEASRANRWEQGQYEVWWLRGEVTLAQGTQLARGREAILWVDRTQRAADGTQKILAYFEGKVTMEQVASDGTMRPLVQAPSWFGRYYTISDIDWRTPVAAGKPSQLPAVYTRGMKAREQQATRRDPNVVPAQFQPGAPAQPYIPDQMPIDPGVQFAPPPAFGPQQSFQPPLPAFNPPPGAPADNFTAVPPANRRIRVSPRSNVRIQAQWFPNATRDQWVAVLDSGVNLIVDGVDQLGTIDVSTDRLVIWTSGPVQPDLSGGQGQRPDTPLEIYMEGNIVFRQGDRVIYADAMYYNVAEHHGIVLEAEMLTPVPEYDGLVRLKAKVLQQFDRSRFQAQGAAITSSRMGVPVYWLQSEQIEFQDQQRPIVDPFTGQPVINPATGEIAVDHDMLATSRNNFVYANEFPILYWPLMATDLENPTYYINSVRVGADGVFGVQAFTEWDVYQLLGWENPPDGTDLLLDLDYLSKRGPAGGGTFRYERDSFFGHGGPMRGFQNFWGIYDTGVDNLGLLRRDVPPSTDWRGRYYARHRQYCGDGYRITGEIGWISDRNFLEQYFETDWDTLKDQTTGLELKRVIENRSWSLTGDARVNSFFTGSHEGRFNHYWLGQPVFNTPLTWYERSWAGYSQLRTALVRPPALYPVDPSLPMAWETPTGAGLDPYEYREGFLAGTRQELDLPLELGPLKVVPYVLGEASYWGADRDGDEFTRLYGQAGIRGSIPMMSVNPQVQSEFWNLNGLAHKITLEGDFFYADSDQDLDRFPLYTPLDDDATEAFRRRFFIPGGTFESLMSPKNPAFLPFDERYFALRTGMQNNVTAQSLEIADDLTVARVGLRQRWQTKRGLPGRERIIDWITFDVGTSIFPNADRDNFGETIGLANYDFRWHVGDRVTILSDGFSDVFEGGLTTYSIGAFLTRPSVGELYVGYRAIEGPLTAKVVSASFNYRMTEKWIGRAGATYDFGPTGNIGQSFDVIRVGESFLMTTGFTYDHSQNNLGFRFLVEPRFLPSRAGRVGGEQLPAVGMLGLE